MDGFAKEVAIIVLIAAAWCGGIITQRMAGPAGGARKASASANAAAGGLLLGAGLCHFLPESRAQRSIPVTSFRSVSRCAPPASL